MENLDLDIHNYKVGDILNLFKLSYNFNKEDLKGAYRLALKTHPDKSGLDPTIFLFFKKAYTILDEIYKFRNKSETSCTHNIKYSVEAPDKKKAQLLKSLDGKSVKEFNSWFNKMFESSRVGEEEVGYGDWFRNYKDKDQKRVTMNDFGKEFENKKKECTSIAVKNDIMEMSCGGGYSLDRSDTEEFSSDIFSKLGFDDLKKAHTETVIPVSNDDFENRVKFDNVESYKNYRNEQNTKALSLEQSKNYLKERENMSGRQDTQRVYNMLKQDENARAANKKWWASLQRLENI